MSAIVTTYPLDGITYDAADAAGYNSARTSGVYSAEEDYTVTPGGGYTVKVSGGRAWVHPAKYVGYSIIKQEPDTLTLPLADAQRPRIDRVVLRYDAAARESYLLVLEGTPASTPTAPAISRTNLLYDLCLAQITRPAGSTAITAGNITDTRLDESLCGVMSDSVTRIPTDQLLKEAQARINALEETATNSASAAAASQRAAAASQSAAANSANAASRSQSAAANSASAAASSQKAAADSQSAAASSASSASGSASAAASSQKAAAASQSAAAASEAAAKKAAAEAGTKAGTDKTLSMDSAPADAKASGDMMAWLHNMLITGEVQYHVTLTDGSLLCASDGSALLATRKIQFA
nr:MAG TPA: Receptor Binding Protein [Caudoviricetes sp.]